jgi:hypothetical protein
LPLFAVGPQFHATQSITRQLAVSSTVHLGGETFDYWWKVTLMLFLFLSFSFTISPLMAIILLLFVFGGSGRAEKGSN